MQVAMNGRSRICGRRIEQRCLSQRPRPSAALLVLFSLTALSFLWRPAQGQGLRSDPSMMGASARMTALDGSYKKAEDLAASLRAAWNPAARSSCSASKGSLCGTGISNKDLAEDALLLAASPMAFDNRDSGNTGGFNPISPPGDQGDCNACVAFAVTAAAEAAVASALRASVPSGKVPRLSPRDLFFCGTGGDGNDCTNGWTFRDGLSQLAGRSTLTSWQCLPFEGISRMSNSQICRSLCSNPISPPGTFSWTRLQRLDSIARVQKHIRMHGGVVTRLNLYKGFKSWFEKGSNKFGVYTDSPSDSNYEQGHAVFVVGYNNKDKYWIVKNSWGSSWADGGFAKIGFGVLGMMDPEFTYGVAFQPRDSWIAPSPVLSSVGGGCYSYFTQAGDYASRIAVIFGVPIETFLADNAQVINSLDAFFTAGQKLKVCNPTKNLPSSGGGAPAPGPGGGKPGPCNLYMGCNGGSGGGGVGSTKADAANKVTPSYNPSAAYMG